jgi:hypothetical protein
MAALFGYRKSQQGMLTAGSSSPEGRVDLERTLRIVKTELHVSRSKHIAICTL